jgi:hypothetical protein
LKYNALHENFAALGSARIMHRKAFAASVIDFCGMMTGMAINISMNDLRRSPNPGKILHFGQ